jgi:hypothetical protein
VKFVCFRDELRTYGPAQFFQPKYFSLSSGNEVFTLNIFRRHWNRLINWEQLTDLVQTGIGITNRYCIRLEVLRTNSHIEGQYIYL